MNNLLLIYGGGGTEHEVSLNSAKFFRSHIDTKVFRILDVKIDKDNQWSYQEESCFLNMKKQLMAAHKLYDIDVALSCIHGIPNETGHLPALFEMINLPYFGCGQETSVLCFNKMVTKLLLEHHGIKTTPFLALVSPDELTQAKIFFNQHKDIFIKATNQGSSVGCYRCRSESEIASKVKKAFALSPSVIIEKTINGREFELSAFDYQGKTHFTHPCEILAPNSDFYTYEEKYSKQSQTRIELKADLPAHIINEMHRQARIAYHVLRIRHLCRIDFFLSQDNIVYMNEINTLPGHTDISMFPNMMEAYGVKYQDYLREHLQALLN